jgi:hypothetical protein
MKRRDFLRANGSMCAGWALSRAVPALADSPSAAEWRTFEVVTRVELLKPDGVSHIWLPAPLIHALSKYNFDPVHGNQWIRQAEQGQAKRSRDCVSQVWCKR